MSAWASSPSNITPGSKRGQLKKKKKKKTMHSWVMGKKNKKENLIEWAAKAFTAISFSKVGVGEDFSCFTENIISCSDRIVRTLAVRLKCSFPWAQSSSPPHCTWSRRCCHTHTQHHTPGGHCPPSTHVLLLPVDDCHGVELVNYLWKNRRL